MICNKFNKKGDIALTLSVVLTIVLFMAGLYAFITDDRNFGQQSKDLASMFNTLSFNENYIKLEAMLIAKETIAAGVEDSKLKEKYNETAKLHKLSIQAEGTFFSNIEHGDFMFENSSNEFIFEIENVTIMSKVGENKVIRTFDIDFKLNKTQA